MKTIAFNATKGGTGKSTLSIITLNSLTAAGFKCLAIDADMINHSLSFYYNSGISFDRISKQNIYKVFQGENIEDNILPINDRLGLLHGNVRLTEFRSTVNLKQLKKTLLKVVGYDYAIIDTAPTFDNITANVFYACDCLVIPTVPDVFNHQSAKYLFEKLEELELSSLKKTIIFNQYERPRTDNKDAFSNQVTGLFSQDDTLGSFIGRAALSRSTVIRKYINDQHYRINGTGKKEKAFAEIKNFINSTLGITLSAEEI